MKTLFAICVALLPVAGWAAEPVDYLRDVKPVFTQHCVKCHGTAKPKGGLRLDTAANALKGGDSGAVIAPGSGDQSRLVKAIRGGDGDVPTMPPDKNPRLSAAQISVISRWIDAGAKAPATEVAEGAKSKITHWAFQPVKRPTLSAVKNVAWVRNPIDYFILARLEKEGISPSPETDRATLARRLSLDLLGLP
ncbi:MAG: c-type cytochrome domain-containing protein, partial [Gemmataceae bacterium]